MLKTKCRRPLSIERGQEAWRPLKHDLDDHLPYVVVAFVHSEEFHFAKMTFCTDAAVAQPTARFSVPKPRLKMSLAPIQTPATPLVDAAVADALMAEHTKAPKARAVQAATLTFATSRHGSNLAARTTHMAYDATPARDRHTGLPPAGTQTKTKHRSGSWPPLE